MRKSALRYMVSAGFMGGIGVVLLVTLVSGLLNISELVKYSAGNNPIILFLLYLTTAMIVAVPFGGLWGVVIGLLNGFYARRFVKRNYAHITDASAYASALAWRIGIFSAALVTTVIMLFYFTPLHLESFAIIALSGLAGGYFGRRFAQLDMIERREKKHTAQDYPTRTTATRRLEVHDTDDDFSLDDESRTKRDVIR